MAALMPYEEAGDGPMIGLRALTASIRRRRRMLLITSLVGLFVGLSLHFVVPAKHQAQTDLYLVQPANTDPAQGMANDVSLLHTEAVAQQAVEAGHLATTSRALLSHYSGASTSDNILSIKFTGSSPAAAVAGARAVAQGFLAVQADQLRLQTDVLVRGLRSQISALNAQVDNLNTQIDALSAGAQASTQLTNLVNQRGADESQVSQLQAQIQVAQLDEQSADHVNHVLDPAAVLTGSVGKNLLIDGLSGLVVGLAVGLAVVVFGALLARRTPDRATVAATLGAPVELSLAAYRRPRTMRRRRLAEQLRVPSVDLRMIARRLRTHVEAAPGSSLAVVAVGEPTPAALAVGALALEMSSEGHRVIVVDAAERRPLADILGLRPNPEAMETYEIPAAEDSAVRLLVAPRDPLLMAQKPPLDEADAVLVLTSLDAGFGAEHLASWVKDAVMILSARGVSPARLVVNRDMLDDAGVALRSVVLLGSDPDDDTSGTVSPVDLLVSPAVPAESPR
jgi:capsular polysaccharide biosynthesis protein